MQSRHSVTTVDVAAVGRLKGKKTLHPLIATASTPQCRPVVVAIRMRKGKSADVRGADRFLAEALATVWAIAPGAQVVVRAASKFYAADAVATAARYGAAVSLTIGSNPSVNAAIARIGEDEWTPIRPRSQAMCEKRHPTGRRP